MITGAHTILFSRNPSAVRMFFRDVLSLNSVDVGGGWLIFALPPSELAAHPVGDGSDMPADAAGSHQLYLMCDDLAKTIERLKAHNVEVTSQVSEHPWGLLVRIRIPDAEEISIYQPRHPLPPR